MKKTLIILSLVITPAISYAAVGTFKDLIELFTGLLYSLIPLIISLALVYFLFGVAQFIMHAGDSVKREEGKTIMMWGIIALFVMVSIWGLVRVLQNTIFGGGGFGGGGFLF